MRDRLKELLNNSYAPYSNFRVSAVVVMKDGTSFNGVNVENAAYGSSICAERSAILAAISNGYKKNDFDKLYVMCDNTNLYFYHDTGWGTDWEKIILVKYTKD